MKTSTATALAMMASSALALPSRLSTRADGDWESEDGEGNVIVRVSDTKIDYGELDPVDALAAIEKCPEISCKPNEAILVPTRWNKTPKIRHVDVQLTVEGNWATEGKPGSKAELLEIAKETFRKMADEENHTKETVTTSDGREICNVNGCRYEETIEVDQWRGTDHIAIRYEGEDSTSFMNIGLDLNEGAHDDGACGNLVGVGGALVGMIPGIGSATGAVFSLASVGCGLLN